MIVLDRATLKDWGRLLVMRNDPDTVANSFSSKPVTVVEHMRWLRSVIDSETLLFVARDTERGVHVGTGRIDLVSPTPKVAKPARQKSESGRAVTLGTDAAPASAVAGSSYSEAQLSITVDSGQRGHGYGTEIVAALVKAVDGVGEYGGKTWEPLATKITAAVKPTNYASLRAFAACGFLPVKCEDDRIELELTR